MLPDKMKTKFVKLKKLTTLTPYGEDADWVEDVEFFACCTLVSQGQERVANKDNEKSRWLITCLDETELRQYDVIKRVRDGKTFKIETEINDIETPDIASFFFKQAYAYEYDLKPKGV